MKFKMCSDNYLFLGVIIFSFFSLLPITRTLPSLVKAGIILASFLLFLITAINYSRNRGKKQTQYFFLAFFLVLLFNFLVFIGEYKVLNEFDFASKYLMMIAFFMPFIVQMLFGVVKDTEIIRKAQKVISFFLVVTTITTIIGSALFKEASRALASNNIDSNRSYQLWNIGGYGFNYALVLTIPWILYQYKKKKEKRYIIFLLLTFCCIVLSSYMTAILLSFFSCVVCLLYPKKEKNIFLFYILAVLAIIAGIMLCNNVDFWNHLMSLVEGNTTLLFRIRNMRDFFINQMVTGDIGLRGALYTVSWYSFLKNPVLGNVGTSEYNELGYHSELLDLLGGCGVIGVVVLLLMVFVVFKVDKKVVYDEKRKFRIVAWIVFLILCMFNTVIGSIEISIVLALLYFPETDRQVVD